MILCIYLSVAAVIVGITVEPLAAKIVAGIVAGTTLSIAHILYSKLKERVSANEKMIKETGKFLIKTSKRVTDIMKKKSETTESEAAEQ